MAVSKYTIVFFISILIFTSCEKSKKSEKIEESYLILNLLISDFERTSILHPTFAPPPSGNYTYSKTDSLRKYMNFYENYIKEKTIIVKSDFFEINSEEIEYLKDCKGFYKIDELNTSNNLRMIEFKYLNSMDSKIMRNVINQNQNYNPILSFSNIFFNENTDKAVILFSVEYSRLNGFTSIIYLEKKYFHWKIVCEKTLTIS